MLAQEQVEEYWREGYLVVRGLIPEATVGKVMEAAGRYGDPVDGAGWSARVFDHKEPAKDMAVHQILRDPDLIATVSRS